MQENGTGRYGHESPESARGGEAGELADGEMEEDDWEAEEAVTDEVRNEENP